MSESEVMKGNFKTRRTVEVDQEEGKDVNSQFEREALKRLGGSIAFVSKGKFLYGMGQASDDPKSNASSKRSKQE